MCFFAVNQQESAWTKYVLLFLFFYQLMFPSASVETERGWHAAWTPTRVIMSGSMTQIPSLQKRSSVHSTASFHCWYLSASATHKKKQLFFSFFDVISPQVFNEQVDRKVATLVCTHKTLLYQNQPSMTAIKRLSSKYSAKYIYKYD